MKKNIHPQWYPDAIVSCACGNSFTIGSTVPEIRVEICNKCHPFYTGEMKYVDTMGRVEKFAKKRRRAQAAQAKLTKKKQRQQQQEKMRQHKPQTLKEMLQAIKQSS